MPSSALWFSRHKRFNLFTEATLDGGPNHPGTCRSRPRPPCRRIRASAFVRVSQLQMKTFSPFRSGKRAALLPLPPLRTGRESFPSSGSSRCKAPVSGAGFHDGLIPASWRWMPNFLRERTFCKIVLPVWIERIGFRPDFYVPPDFGVAGVKPVSTKWVSPPVFVFRYPPQTSIGACRWGGSIAPSPIAAIFLDVCVWPTPEPAPNLEVHPLERVRRHDVPMVVRPTPDDRVELTYQAFLTDGFVRLTMMPRTFSKNACVFFFDGLTSSLPSNLRRCCPRKSNPWSICVMQVFSGESCKPRSRRNCSTRGRTSFSSTSLVAPVMMKSSAYRIRLILGLMVFPACPLRSEPLL
jgi:hypothetical protein